MSSIVLALLIYFKQVDNGLQNMASNIFYVGNFMFFLDFGSLVTEILRRM